MARFACASIVALLTERICGAYTSSADLVLVQIVTGNAASTLAGRAGRAFVIDAATASFAPAVVQFIVLSASQAFAIFALFTDDARAVRVAVYASTVNQSVAELAFRASARARRALGAVITLAFDADGVFKRAASVARSVLNSRQAGNDDEQEDGKGADAGEATEAPSLGSAFLLGRLLVAVHLHLLELVSVVDFARHEAQLEDEDDEHEEFDNDGPGQDVIDVQADFPISPDLALQHRYQV